MENYQSDYINNCYNEIHQQLLNICQTKCNPNPTPSIKDTIYYTTTNNQPVSSTVIQSNTSVKSNEFNEELGKFVMTFEDDVTEFKQSMGQSFTSIEFINFPNLTTIGDNFLLACLNLEHIDMSGLYNVESIGNSFLNGCGIIETIDLTPLKNLTTIGNNFLSMSIWGSREQSLKNINVSGLNKLKSIGDSFLINCRNLQTLDMSGLNNLTNIGNNFLSDCRDLRTLDMSGLSKLQSIPGNDNFLSSCRNLQTLDMSGLSKLQSIPNDFLCNFYNLTSLNLSGMSSLTTIGDNFLCGVKNLNHIDLSEMINLTTIGNNFLNNVGTSDVNMSNLTQLTTVGDDFFTNFYGSYDENNYCKIHFNNISNLINVGERLFGNVDEFNNDNTIGFIIIYADNCSIKTKLEDKLRFISSVKFDYYGNE